MKKAIAIILSMALMLPLFTCFASASGYNEYVKTATPLTYDHSAILNENVLYDGTYRQSEKYVSYTPNSDTYPIVYYGNQLYGKQTLESAAKQLKNKGLVPVAGINADYFSFETGMPLGMVMIDGVVHSSCTTQAAMAFYEDGHTYMGDPRLSTKMSFGNVSYTIDHVNKARTVYGIYMYTSYFAASTKTTSAGYDVVVKPESTDLKLGVPVTATVVDVFPSDGAIAIPDGCWVMSVDMKANSDKILTLESIAVGTEMTIEISAVDQNFNTAKYIVGGAEKLVTNGTANSALGTVRAPRTAVGAKADGEIVFYTVDGRQSGTSTGLTLDELAVRMQELGCVSALNLDGGGSTTIGVTYPTDTGMNIINKPSDGAQRSCANFLFLVHDSSSSGTAKSLYVTASDKCVIKGSQIQIGAVGVDEHMNKANLSDPITFSCEGGTIDSRGVLKVTSSGMIKVTATSGSLTGYTVIYSTAYNTGMDVYYGGSSVLSLTLSPGESVQLNTYFTSYPCNASYTNEAATWTVTGSIGTINESGYFTASRSGGSGKITATYGDKYKNISVSVAQSSYLFENFESQLPFTDTEISSAVLDIEKVAKGRASARLTFTGIDSIPAQITTDASVAYLGMWVYGDGSESNVTLIFDNQATTSFALDFEGWKYVSLTNPTGAGKLTAIASDNACEFNIDQIIGTYSENEDATHPEMSFESVTAGGTTITLSGESLSHLSVAVDGISTTYTKSGNTVTLAPYLAPGIHRISACAIDISGNVTRISYDLTVSGAEASTFSDMTTNWAKNYVEFLYTKGVASGEEYGGTKIYRPSSNMTRAEFAVLITKCLGYDLESYSDKSLVFADAADVPSWAENAVKAAYSEGIISGSNDENGDVVFRANATITRAEVVAVIGRTLEKGYAKQSLTFTDSDAIPSWASDYFATLVPLKIITGYSDGSVKPSANITRAEAAKVLYSLY